MRPDAQIAVICTVSPASTDTEHSLATLRTASMLMGRDGGEPEETVPVEAVSVAGSGLADQLKANEQKPSKWNHDTLVEWIEGLGSQLAAAASVLPQAVDGKAILRWPKQRFGSLFDGDARRGAELFGILHDVVKRGNAAVSQQRKIQRKAIANKYV